MHGLTQETAEIIGLKALTWLAGHDELRPIFMGATGAGEDDMRQGAGNAEFLGSVLDFIMQDDAWVVACCDAHGLEYAALMQARQSLPGGGQVHWT